MAPLENSIIINAKTLTMPEPNNPAVNPARPSKNVRVANLDVFKTWLTENDLDLDLDEALATLAKVRTLK
jgi:hypothetical protein